MQIKSLEEEWIKELEFYIETNWQKMNGGDLVDVDPKEWLLSVISKIREAAKEETREEMLEALKEKDNMANLEVHKGFTFAQGYNVAYRDIRSLLSSPTTKE